MVDYKIVPYEPLLETIAVLRCWLKNPDDASKVYKSVLFSVPNTFEQDALNVDITNTRAATDALFNDCKLLEEKLVACQKSLRELTWENDRLKAEFDAARKQEPIYQYQNTISGVWTDCYFAVYAAMKEEFRRVVYPGPVPAQPSRELLRAIVDATWGHAYESEQFPSTATADKIINSVLSKFPENGALTTEPFCWVWIHENGLPGHGMFTNESSAIDAWCWISKGKAVALYASPVPPPSEQEPIVYLCWEKDGDLDYTKYNPIRSGTAIFNHRMKSENWEVMPVYASPAPAQQVEITGEIPDFTEEELLRLTNLCQWDELVRVPAQQGNSDREEFNAWNNENSCPLAGRDPKSAAWMAWQARARLVQTSIPPEHPLRNSMSSNHRSYAEGWNKCRAAMISGDQPAWAKVSDERKTN